MSWSALKYFNLLADTQVTLNHLPHWQQEQACYFVTYRLADSLPAPLLDKFRKDRAAWKSQHPEPWDEATEAEYHRLFSAQIDHWLDAGHGKCLLKHPPYAAEVSNAFHFFNKDRYLLHAFVVMPNHVHLLFSLAEGESLSKVIHSWKRHTAREINKLRGKSETFWQEDYFDRLIRDPRHFLRVVRYIRKNLKQYPPALHYESAWISGLS
jgi:REP element-mobilizing transposase RayT